MEIGETLGLAGQFSQSSSISEFQVQRKNLSQKLGWKQMGRHLTCACTHDMNMHVYTCTHTCRMGKKLKFRYLCSWWAMSFTLLTGILKLLLSKQHFPSCHLVSLEKRREAEENTLFNIHFIFKFCLLFILLYKIIKFLPKSQMFHSGRCSPYRFPIANTVLATRYKTILRMVIRQ